MSRFTWTLLYIIGLACQCTALVDIDEFCHRMRTGTEAIATIGILSDRILLITSNNSVFTLPTKSLNSRFDRLNFYGRGASLMEQKWPKLYAQQSIFVSKFLIQDNSLSFLYMVAHNKSKDAVFRIDSPSKSYETLSIHIPHSSNEVWLSSNEPLTTYSLRSIDGHTMIRKLTFSGSNTMQLASDAKVSGYAKICETATQVYFILNGEKNLNCNQPANWAITSGFVDQYRFYLFDGSYVRIFNQEIFSQPGKKSDLHKVAYSSFLDCDTQVLGIYWAMISVALMFAMVVLGECACFIYALCGGPKRNAKKVIKINPIKKVRKMKAENNFSSTQSSLKPAELIVNLASNAKQGSP